MKIALKKLDGAELNGRRLRLIDDYRGRKKRCVRHFKVFTGFISFCS